MVNRRVQGYLLLAAAFVVGAASGGGAAFGWVARRHAAILREDAHGPEVRRVRMLTRKLDLDAEQERRIRVIVGENRNTLHELGRDMLERCGGPLRDQKARIDAQIRAVLRPDQAERYDNLLEERREHMWLAPGHRRGDSH